MAKLTVDWQKPTIGSYEGFEADNLLASLPEEYRDGRPVLIFLDSERDEDANGMKLAAGVLADERIAVGSKMFHKVRMDGTKIGRDHIFAKALYGRKLPRFVVLEATGRKVGAVEGKPTPSSLFRLMKRAAGKSYKTNIDKMIKNYQRVLTDLDKLDGNKKSLQVRRNASSERLTRAKERRYEKIEAELAKVEEGLVAREMKILDFVMKKSKVAKG